MVNTSMFQKSLEQKEIQIQTVKMFQSLSFFFSFYTWNGLRLDFYNRTITITIPNTILFFLILLIILQY